MFQHVVLPHLVELDKVFKFVFLSRMASPVPHIKYNKKQLGGL